jgi:hypothetical protein
MFREGCRMVRTERRPCVRLLVALLIALFARSAYAQPPGIEMPDPKQMSGIPRPVTDLPPGSVSVRLIKGELSNNIADFPVELSVNGKVQTVKTDAQGRAQFDKLPAGATLKATATVEGEKLESQEFPAPSSGGIRLMLVATDKEKAARTAAEASAPAVPGAVVLGGETRVIIEPGDEKVSVYYLIDVMNNARTPIKPTPPFDFELPKGALGASFFQGSTPLAKLTGTHVHAEGPFPPGKTSMQLAYTMPVASGTVNIEQRFPTLVEQPAVIVTKFGDTRLTSPQLDRQQDMNDGKQAAIVGMGNALPAGQPLTLHINGLLHHSPAPRWAALSLAVGIVLVGVWLGRKPADTIALKDERKRLIAKRERLFQELVRLEQDHRNGRGDRIRQGARREELLAELERIYGALDDELAADTVSRAEPGRLDSVRAS